VSLPWPSPLAAGLRARTMVAHPPIVVAAAAGDLAAVRRLLAEGVGVDSCGKWTETEDKVCAVSRAETRLSLRACADSGAPSQGFYDKSWDWDSDTALCAAVRGGHTEVVQALLDAGASPTFKVCNFCDKHETPRTIALEVQSKHPACAQLLLGPAFEEQRSKVEAEWAACDDPSAASLFELAARELLVCTATEKIGEVALTSMNTMELLLKACRPLALLCVPDTLHKRVESVWSRAKIRAAEQEQMSAECIGLGHLYLRGEGVAVDEAAALHWLLRGLRSRPVEHVAKCWGGHADYPYRAPYPHPSGDCFSCKTYHGAQTAIADLANSTAVGAMAAAALATELKRSSALLDTSLHHLELQRQATKIRLEAERKVEVDRLRTEAQEQQRVQDEHFNTTVRQPEVERCKQFEVQRRASGFGGGACMDRNCSQQDYCTYWHDGRPDLPPMCRWGSKCCQGQLCWCVCS